jgi:hypothetical protein
VRLRLGRLRLSVLNRKKSGKWGGNIKAVVTSAGMDDEAKGYRATFPNDPRYQIAAIIADAASRPLILRRRNTLPQSNNRSREAGRFTTAMGKW